MYFYIFIVFFLLSQCPECLSSDMIQCADRTKCIPVSNMCNFVHDCPDSSDENPIFCLAWPKSSRCGSGEIYCHSRSYSHRRTCYTYAEACKIECQEQSVPTNICEILKAKVLPQNYYHVRFSSVQTEEIFQFLSRASTHGNQTNECPSLYNRIGNSCISFVRAVKVTFREAMTLCDLIGGELTKIDDLLFFQELLNELKHTDSDFWIGGQFTNGNWTWLDTSSVQMGAPFWGLRRQTDECAMTSIMPNSDKDNQCIAISSVNHYYFSDEGCHTRRSPLCIKKSKKIIVNKETGDNFNTKNDIIFTTTEVLDTTFG